MIACDQLLPQLYDKNIIGFLCQGPGSVYVYWELSLSQWETVERAGGAFIRLYSVLENQNSDYDYVLIRELQPLAYTRNWYFNDLAPGLMYSFEIGVKLPDGIFFPLIKSEKVVTPPLPKADTAPKLRTIDTAAPPVQTSEFYGDFKKLAGVKMEICLDLMDVVQTMPFYMGYDTQLAG